MNDFTIHKGEAKNKSIIVYEGNPLEKKEYQLKENEYYLFEMKKNNCSQQILISKKFENNKIQFTNADTKDLSIGNYPFQVKLILADGEFIVVIDKSFIEVIS